MTTIELAIKGDVHRLSPLPGDKLLIVFAERLPRNYILDAREHLQKLFPLNEVICLAGVEAVALLPKATDQIQRVGR